MRLKKILLLASMALAGVAFAAPAHVKAQLKEEGIPLEVGAEVTATSSNLEMKTSIFTIICSSVTLHLEVENNGTDVFTLAPLGAPTMQNCKLKEANAPVTFLHNTFSRLAIGDLGGAGEAGTTSFPVSFFDPAHEEPVLQCHYEGSLLFQVATPGGDVLNLKSSVLKPGFCALGYATISAEFTLETAGGTPVEIHYSPE